MYGGMNQYGNDDGGNGLFGNVYGNGNGNGSQSPPGSEGSDFMKKLRQRMMQGAGYGQQNAVMQPPAMPTAPSSPVGYPQMRQNTTGIINTVIGGGGGNGGSGGGGYGGYPPSYPSGGSGGDGGEDGEWIDGEWVPYGSANPMNGGYFGGQGG